MSPRFAPPICPDAPISPGPRFRARICRSPGAGAGLDGARSGAFWGFCSAMRILAAQRRAPRLIVLENVAGVLTSKGGEDFAAICAALQGLGYRFGALTIDAAHFLPQSRPRVFIVAIRRGHSPPAWLVSPGPPSHHASAALQRAAAALPPQLAADWLWWRAPEPPRANLAARRLPRRRAERDPLA